jgi:hypothetical protein
MYTLKNCALALCGLLIATACSAAPVLVVPGSKSALHVAIDFPEGMPHALATNWQLTELNGAGSVVLAQSALLADMDGKVIPTRAQLLAIIPASEKPGGTRRFRLNPVPGVPDDKFALAFRDLDDKSLKLSEGNQPVLVYNHGTITNDRVPQKDKRRSRGCYIHPLWGLDGEMLTDDFPKDHYHHHGVFWAWPHVKVGGKEYDLWMYNNITPRFVRWLARQSGPVAAVLGVENGWFVGEKKVMIERVWLRTYKAGADHRVLDLDFTWIPVDEPITLRGAEGKSYGGLTVRFAVKSDKDSVITVPGGQSKQDLPETPLPWADLTAHFRGPAAEPSGAAIFVPPSHPDYPPTWLTRHYGPLCIGWPGVKDKTFPPGKPIRLSYRLWIHKGAVTVEQLKDAYEAYTAKVKSE